MSIAERDRQDVFRKREMEQLDSRNTLLCQTLTEREERVAALERTVAEAEAQKTAFSDTVAESEKTIRHLNVSLIALQEKELVLRRRLSRKEQRITSLNLVISDRDESIRALHQTVTERDKGLSAMSDAVSSLQSACAEQKDLIASLAQGRALQEARVEELNNITSDLTSQISRLRQTEAEHNAQVESLNSILADRQHQIAALRLAVAGLKKSVSWRVTAPLRSVYDVLKKVPGISRRQVRQGPRRVTPAVKPAFLSHLTGVPNGVDSFHGTNISGTNNFVPDSPAPEGFVPSVRLVAFYLPQFHPIPENDEWWGKGFTEWKNVSAAQPQFRNHYQPHIPGDLGFYDLRTREIQGRQVELAKQYGIGAFCFYFYWFNGKRLLELPVQNYRNDPKLDLPFCLCWANENWTRRWDGLDQEVLISQNYSPEDDLAFISHVADYMRDCRYLRVNGRPVLLVYRPSLLPDAKATARRWREWCRQNGIGELYLVYPQSFEICDPAEYGFDAATEFPPNLSDPPVITNSVEALNPNFSGIVYDWRIFVQRSRQYSIPAYKLFRGICPSWDNESRHRRRGTIFMHSSPEGYQEWLENAVADTRARLPREERLIFVNAWNEWAEGAHLEPDRRYGYAWLRATRAALPLPRSSGTAVRGRIVVVTHDANPHGGQYIALAIVRELVCSLHFEVATVCLGDGPLKSEFAEYGAFHDLSGVDPEGLHATRLANELYQSGFRHAIVNTTVSGLFLPLLKQAGLSCIALVHELRELILSYKLEKHARVLAHHAERIVFPAFEVQQAFSEFATMGEGKGVIRPQGVVKRNRHVHGSFDVARRVLRDELGLPADAFVILGVGYADLRKGVDLFVEIAAETVNVAPRAHFVWVGHSSPDEERRLATIQKENPSLFSHLHFIGRRDDTDLYYAGADVFALTSREDPFPCVVLEAMDVGLPIVAFAGSGGSNALIARGIGENVPMGNTPAFAETIQRFLSDSVARKRIADRAQELIARDFSFRHYVFDLVQLAGINLHKVSVIVPNYNYERYLKSRLESILDQTYPIYELIVLDDASRDNSLAVAHDLLFRKNIEYKIVTNSSNSGCVSTQWKRGLDLVRGDVVWIAEADDLSHPDFLSKVLPGLDDPEVVLSYCESMQIDQDGFVLASNYQDYVADLGGERWQKNFVNDGTDEILRFLAIKNTIPNVSAVLMRTKEILKVMTEQFDNIRPYRVAGDWMTYLHLLNGRRLAYVPVALNMHRRHDQGVAIGSLHESHFSEIREVQEWVATRYTLDPKVRLKAMQYLEALVEHFGIHGVGETAPTT
ncbi:MAG: glycoside hydrolase family 99-like domain-containing protein [Acidobacteriota bacterium]|nr:glycoside hydrolase family 99-like domain-containing protein [Acidobacteriota bacterium]